MMSLGQCLRQADCIYGPDCEFNLDGLCKFFHSDKQFIYCYYGKLCTLQESTCFYNHKRHNMSNNLGYPYGVINEHGVFIPGQMTIYEKKRYTNRYNSFLLKTNYNKPLIISKCGVINHSCNIHDNNNNKILSKINEPCFPGMNTLLSLNKFDLKLNIFNNDNIDNDGNNDDIDQKEFTDNQIESYFDADNKNTIDYNCKSLYLIYGYARSVLGNDMELPEDSIKQMYKFSIWNMKMYLKNNNNKFIGFINYFVDVYCATLVESKIEFTDDDGILLTKLFRKEKFTNIDFLKKFGFFYGPISKKFLTNPNGFYQITLDENEKIVSRIYKVKDNA